MKPSQYAGECQECGRDWQVGTEVHMSKDPNTNKWIVCTDKDCFIKKGGKLFTPSSSSSSSSQKIPLDQAPKYHQIAEEMLEKFKSTRQVIFEKASEIDEGPPPNLKILTVQEELQAIESFFKTLSGSYKPQ